jgi:serine/threonine-protein kinase RsbW
VNGLSPAIYAISMPNELGCEKHARHLLAWLLPQLGLGPDRIADLQTAVSEACINAIEHGNQGQPGRRVAVEVSFTAAYVDTVVTDEGLCCYQPRQTPPATIVDKVAGEAAPRGMGVSLIEALVDEATFVPAQPGCGNQVWLRLYR